MLRYLVACSFWLPFLIYSSRTGHLDKRVWKYAIVPALANIALQSLWARAYYYIEPGFANLLAKLSTLFVIIFSMLLFAEERALIKSWRFWSGILLSIAGVVGVLIFKEDFRAAGTITGIVIILVFSVTWGVYTVSAKVAFKEIDVRSGFSVMSIYTAVGLCLLAFVFGDPTRSLKLTTWPWACIVISGISSIALAHVLYHYSVKRIGASIPSLAILVVPFTVLGLSHIIWQETLNGYQLMFGIVLLIGVGLSLWSQQHLKQS